MRCLDKLRRVIPRHLKVRAKAALGRLSLTEELVDLYCRGRGIEVGPGDAPYCDPKRTITVDKFLPADVQADAAALPFPDGSVDYLLSSHCLEHCPNTIKVLREWIRVLRPNGYLFLVLPHGERTFDRGRKLTTLTHHIEDFDRNVSFEDMTHWPEFEKFSIPQYNHAWIAEGTRPDGTIDPLWCVNHGEVHYHVWTQHEMSELLRYLGLSIAAIVECLPERLDSFATVGRVNQ